MEQSEDLAEQMQADVEALGGDATIEGCSIAGWIRRADGASRMIRLAVCRAMHELLWTSGRAGFGEEHQTASLMGHLTSQVGWYARLAATEAEATGNEGFAMPDIRWAHQERGQEARTGVDFGLLCNPSGEDAPDTEVRLVLLQAKRATLGRRGAERFAVDQKTGMGNKSMEEARPLLNNEAMELCLEAAREEQKGRLTGANELKAIAARLREQRAEEPRYQMETLLRTQFMLATHGEMGDPWCFYAVWRRPPQGRSPPRPVAVTLNAVAKTLYVRERDRETAGQGLLRAGDVDLEDMNASSHDLIAVLARALDYEDAGFGLRLPLSKVEEAMGEACRLLPDLDLVTSSSTETGGHALAIAIEGKFKVSPALLPPQPLPASTPTAPDRGPGYR